MPSSLIVKPILMKHMQKMMGLDITLLMCSLLDARNTFLMYLEIWINLKKEKIYPSFYESTSKWSKSKISEGFPFF